MFNARFLLATIVFSCVILECYTSEMPNIKCYNGKLMVTKNETQKEKEKEPKLEVCRGVCSSTYFRTDVTELEHGTVLAGSYFKSCVGRKGDLTEMFGEDVDMTMDQCVEDKNKRIKSGKLVHCICSTTECNGGIHAVLSTLSFVFAMTVFILTQWKKKNQKSNFQHEIKNHKVD